MKPSASSGSSGEKAAPSLPGRPGGFPRGPLRPLLRLFHAAEDALSRAALVALVLVPAAEIAARRAFRTAVPGSTEYTHHLVLAVAFLAGAVTSRGGRHLTMALNLPLPAAVKTRIRAAVATLCAAVASALALSSLGFALYGFEPGLKAGVIPVRVVTLVMVYGYLMMGVRFVAGRGLGRRSGLLLVPAVLLGTALAFPSLVKVVAGLAGGGTAGGGAAVRAAGGAAAPAFLAALEAPMRAFAAAAGTPLIVILIVGAFFGAPLFVVLGGIAYLLFARQGLPLEVVPNQAYVMLTGFSIAAIPLFTITGFVLSDSKAGDRLIRLFRSFFSWAPGGLAVMAILVCAFFTTFTGASGVTIVALGGLLLFVLTGGGYGRRFTVGLLTAAGSIGLLFPPSLPVIIYGVTAQVSIKEMFMGGIVPGLLMVSALAALSVVYALRRGIERRRFTFGEALSAVRGATWEMLLPVVIFIGYFGVRGAAVRMFSAALVYVLALEYVVRGWGQGRKPGAVAAGGAAATALFLLAVVVPGLTWLSVWTAGLLPVAATFAAEGLFGRGGRLGGLTGAAGRYVATLSGAVALLIAASSVSLTLVESAAVAALYAMVVQMTVHRDLRPADLTRTLDKSLPIIGGTLTILALASALSFFLVDAEIPVKLTQWVTTAITSKYVFLLILNLVLLVVGSLMDIYSAILVVVPLILPLGALFHVHPVHLGIIFLANMELGYLTPPVGLNLYLSSYRFEEPLVRVYRDVQPFLLVHLVTVLLITYLPFLTTVFTK